MNSVNIEELTKKVNEFRMSNQNKTFTRNELFEALKKMGFNKVIGAYLLAQFPAEKMGTSKLYSVPKEPIHKNYVGALFTKQKKTRSNSYNKTHSLQSEEAALALLTSKGYQIRKCTGFDLERFAKENPVLYKKYLKYEIV